jgi:hypothetical protein
MENEVTFRTFKKGDYEMCCKWWKWWWKDIPVKKALLPDDIRCFVIESNGVPVAASFLFAMVNPLVGYNTWTISNPEYREKDRRQMLELLITCIEQEARDRWGMKMVFTVCGNRFMEQIHRKLGWDMHKTDYEAFKYL